MQGADHRRRFRHGRAAAIAFAREGADVAINYLPAEEPDAREVVQLIRAEERKAVALPGDIGENIIDYAVTKGAIVIFNKGLAKQLAAHGIRVNAIAPGPVWTPLQVTGGQPEDKLPQFGANTPLGRAGQPAELAPLYVLLASGEASYSTGQVFGAVAGRGGP